MPEDTELITGQMAKDIRLVFLRGKKKFLERRMWRGGWRGQRGGAMATNRSGRCGPDGDAMGMRMKGFKGNVGLCTQALEPQHFLGDRMGRGRCR
jgi:hypothetical protein